VSTRLHSAPGFRPAVVDGRPGLDAARASVRALACLPFDALRLGYAAAVQAGAARRSMLDSRDVERRLDALERLLLGPFARRV